jgi:hypothetical protein
LAAFSQIYSENQEQKEEQKDLKKTCNLAREGKCLKVGPRKSSLLKRLASLKRSHMYCIRTMEKMPAGISGIDQTPNVPE